MRILFSIWLFLSLVSAKTLEYTWDLSWRFVAPDGFGRPVISVNGQWPPPHINGVAGDRVIVHVLNNLGNETASIHWHGLSLIGQNTMDGPVGTTQCPIPPGSEFTYDFNVRNMTHIYLSQSNCYVHLRSNKLGLIGGMLMFLGRLPMDSGAR